MIFKIRLKAVYWICSIFLMFGFTANAQALNDSSFVFMDQYADGFVYDLKYATADNFLKQSVYPCADCLIRKNVADALVRANNDLKRQGYRIKFYDCYRPIDVQKKMWSIYPNAQYVANPYKTGSMHNRGVAVDITLVDEDGNEVDMGTPFDYFGEKAHQDFKNLPDLILYNRSMLKEAMEANGFRSIRTEWWHYSFISNHHLGLSNFPFQCE
jgi:zinc D-Ala-D-Ala dipeptidase